MGLKSGSRDSGLDDAEESSEQENEAEDEASQANTEPSSTNEAQPPENDSTEIDESDSGKEETEKTESGTSDAPSVESIPYKLRRSQVNEGREQVPYFLRPEIIDAEDQLKATLEAELDETVYKSDYREAAMVVAQRRPELVAEVLREWGYDFGNG